MLEVDRAGVPGAAVAARVEAQSRDEMDGDEATATTAIVEIAGDGAQAATSATLTDEGGAVQATRTGDEQEARAALMAK